MQVGFNAGGGKIFYAVNASRTPAILGINHMSNINVPGKFAFRIDSAEIQNGGCNVNGMANKTNPGNIQRNKTPYIETNKIKSNSYLKKVH